MGREIAALDGLNEQCLKGINHTKASDASVIFQRLTLLLVCPTTSKVKIRKCLLNLWSTWAQKYFPFQRDPFVDKCPSIFLTCCHFCLVSHFCENRHSWEPV